MTDGVISLGPLFFHCRKLDRLVCIPDTDVVRSLIESMVCER